MSEPDLSSPPTLREMARLARGNRAITWPIPEKPPSTRVNFLTMSAVWLVALLAGLIAIPHQMSLDQASPSREQAPAGSIQSYPLTDILASGTSFQICKREITDFEHAAISNAVARGAQVQVVAEAADPELKPYIVPAGLILEDGVLVNGGRWLRVR